MSQPYRKRRSILALLVVATTLPVVGSATPAAAATGCNFLQKLLGLCAAPAPTPTPTASPTQPAPSPAAACGGIATLP